MSLGSRSSPASVPARRGTLARPSRSGRCRRARCCVPSPARTIVSASIPPRTMSAPTPVVIVSEPPISDSIVSTRPSVIGCVAEVAACSATADVIRPLSPNTRLRPLPASMVSPSARSRSTTARSSPARVASVSVIRSPSSPRDHDVVAVAGRDRVGAAGVGVGRPDAVDVGRVAVERAPSRRSRCRRARSRRRRVLRLVAVRRDRVVVDAADTTSRPPVPVVITSWPPIVVSTAIASDDEPADAVGLVARAAVAEHGLRERLELRELRRVGASAERAAGVEVEDAAAVAEDDVAARAAVDRVVALAAEDDERQRRGLRVDGVVVRREDVGHRKVWTGSVFVTRTTTSAPGGVSAGQRPEAVDRAPAPLLAVDEQRRRPRRSPAPATTSAVVREPDVVRARSSRWTSAPTGGLAKRSTVSFA